MKNTILKMKNDMMTTHDSRLTTHGIPLTSHVFHLTSHVSLLTMIFFLLFSTSLFAYDFTNGGVRNAAMGGTGIASTNDASAALWNPAFLAEISYYQFISDSRKYSVQLDNDELSDNSASFAIPLKSIGTLALAGGVTGSNIYDETRFGVSFGSAALSKVFFGRDDKLLIGASLQSYMTGFSDPDYYTPDGEITGFDDGKSAFDADLGIVYKPAPFLQLGLTVNRLMSANMALEDGGSDKLPRKIGMGANLNFGALNIAADYAMEQGENITETGFAVGAEYQVADNLYLRTGLNNLNLTAGVGIDVYHRDWLDEFASNVDGMADVTTLNIGVDYAFQTPFLDNEAETEYGNHYFGVTLSYGRRTVGDNELAKMFPDQYSSGLDLDSLYFARVKADTVYKEVTLYDTLRVIERVADEDVVNERLSQESERIKLEQVGDINKASVFLIRSLEYFYAEQYTLAIDMCERAIATAPNLSLSYLRLASIYYRLNERQQALEYLDQGLRIDPTNEELLRLRQTIANQ
ncbi:MAG: tetratricopeptide repeat protein [Candidatus Cloacimonetes bacterium]|nr:tetratricopeptide repeat protein [Candidatus Cloacimonadota bacterium]